MLLIGCWHGWPSNDSDRKISGGGLRPRPGTGAAGDTRPTLPPTTNPQMTFLLLVPVLLTTVAFFISGKTRKAPEVEHKGDTFEKPEPPTLYQGFKGPIDPILLSRIRNSYGEATAILVNKHHENNQETKTPKRSQTLRSNRTNILNTRGEDNYTFLYDLDSALAAGYDLNSNPLSHSDIGSNHDHSCLDSGHSHSSHDYGSSHDFGGFDCGSD